MLQVKIWFQNRRNKWKRKLAYEVEFRNLNQSHQASINSPRPTSALMHPSIDMPGLYRDENFSRNHLSQQWSPYRSNMVFEYPTSPLWNTSHYGLYHPPIPMSDKSMHL